MESNLQYYPTAQIKKAVTIVVHGLNVKPSAMLSLIEWLNSEGSDACLIKLSGHHKDSININHISQAIWEQDMYAGYKAAKEISVRKQLPLFFLGYSLGALLGQAMILFSDGNICIDKQVLFAPAIAIRTRSYLLKLLFWLKDSLTLPSYAPEKYRANKRLPLRIYKIMYGTASKILETSFQQTNIPPTLVFVDPLDELISYRKLIRFSEQPAIKNYEVVKLDSNMNNRYGGYHHLIINEYTMGEKNWKMVTGKMKAFLFQ